jgi:5'-deoxynucleotidase
MDEKFHFFAYLSRMKFINRWGLMWNTYNENIQEHSLQVAVIAHALAEIKNCYFKGNVDSSKVALLAVFHDSNEIFTGDMPTPVKYFNDNITKVYKDVEEIAKFKLFSMLPKEMENSYKNLFIKKTEDEEDWLLVKAADRISAYIKCIEEEKNGNKEFIKAKTTILESINKINLEEVKYFMENFIPSFYLSLDELE